MKTFDYFEYKLTKPDGTVIYSESSQHILAPLRDEYARIEQITSYTDGTSQVFVLKGEEQ